jgi:hypothetical protein
VARSIEEVGTHALLVLEHVPGGDLRHHGVGPGNSLGIVAAIDTKEPIESRCDFNPGG